MPLSPRVPEIGALDLLLTLAEQGSLGKAAAKHEISQPAAASRIRNLERLLGLTLISRSPTGSALTEHGAVIVDWARRVVDAAAALDAGVTALRTQQGGRIQVACSMTIAEYLLPDWLAELRRRRPEAVIGMQVTNSSSVAALVRDGTADLGFVEGPERPSGVDSHEIAADELQLVVPPEHPWARRRRPVTVGELATTSLITREAGSGTRDTLEHELTRLGYFERAEAIMELSSTTAIKAAVHAGIGPAVLSSLALADDLAQGRLVLVPTTGLDLHRTLRLILRSGQQLPAIFRDVLAATSQIEPRQRDLAGQPAGRRSPGPARV